MSGGQIGQPASLWRSIKVVAWAFLGIRKNSEYEHDFKQVKPLTLIIVGVLGGAVFVLTLVGIVRLVLASAGAR